MGFGKDGSVWLATNANAVKLYEQYGAFERERDVYRRLAAHGVTDILGSAVPQVVEVEPTLGVIEMSFVRPPFVLDFATAELDHRTEFPEDVMQEWWERKRRDFGVHWGQTVAIIRALEKFGIYMTDIHPGNIRFPEMQRREVVGAASSSSSSS